MSHSPFLRGLYDPSTDRYALDTHTRRAFAAMVAAGLAASTGRAYVTSRHRVGIIGVPINSSGNDRGVARAPAVLRAHGLINQLAGICDVKDFGDVSFAPPTEHRDAKSGVVSLNAAVSMVAAVHNDVSKVRAEGRFPVIIGGDCSVMLGALTACRDALGRIGLVFVDGHEDAYPPHQSPTGEIADLEFGFAIGRYLTELPPAFAALFPVVAPNDTVIVGARDTADLQRDGVASVAKTIRVLSDAELRLNSLSEAGFRESERLVAAGVKGVWLHTDLDVLSTESLPAVDYLQPGGFSWLELTDFARSAIRDPAALGWDVTIYNPDLDTGQAHAARIVRLVVDVLAS